jgi:hypothetical protein
MNNNTNTNSNTGYYLLGLIIILILFFYLFKSNILQWFNKSSSSKVYTLISSNTPITQDFSITNTFSELVGSSNSPIQSPDGGNAITIKCELNIPNTISNDGWNSSFLSLKPIIKIGSSPSILYNPKDGVLVFIVLYRDNPYYPHYTQIPIDLPIQGWNQVIFTINNRNVKIYLNGTIIKFIKLDNTAVISSNPNDLIKIGQENNNIIGNIRNLSITFADTQDF